MSHPLVDLGGGGQKVKIQLFQNNVMLHIKLKGITNAVAWWQIFCSQTPTQLPTPLPLRLGSKGQFHLFQTMVMLHIKLKRKKMQQHGTKYFACSPSSPPTLPPTHPDPGDWVKIQLFQNMVMLQIKLKRKTNAATWYQIFCLQTPSPPPPPYTLGDGVNMSKFTFLEHGRVAYQIKENHKCSNMVAGFSMTRIFVRFDTHLDQMSQITITTASWWTQSCVRSTCF